MRAGRENYRTRPGEQRRGFLRDVVTLFHGAGSIPLGFDFRPNGDQKVVCVAKSGRSNRGAKSIR
jgi:hypothetical protein